MDVTELFTLAEASEYLSISVPTLNMWRHLNKGPAYFKVGGKVRYEKADVDRWVQSRKVVPNDTVKAGK